MSIHAIKTNFPSNFNDGTTTWYIMKRTGVFMKDERGLKITVVARNKHDAIRKYKEYKEGSFK